MTANLFANAHNADVERAVLAVLLDGRHGHLLGLFAETCPTPEHFWNTKHQWVARVVHFMLARGERIDAQTVGLTMQRIRYQDFHEKGKPVALEEGLTLSDSLAAGMPMNEVMDLMAAFGPVAGFETNCQALAEFYAQRQAIRVLSEAQERVQAADGSVRVGRIADDLMNQLARMVANQDGTATLAQAMERALVRHDAQRKSGEARVATWGLQGLDRVIPLRAGRFIVLAAQPNHGKTSLALQAATASAEALGRGSVGLVSLEMPAEELGTILLAREMQIRTRTIDQGKLSAEQSHLASEIVRRWGDSDIFLRSSSGRCTVDDVCAWIRQRHLRSGGRLSLVVFDYLQLVDPKPRQSTFEALSEATRALKRIALDLRICLLVLSQLNRDGSKADRDTHGRTKQNPEPRLQDLRGSGTIEQDADGVVFIWPPVESTTDVLPVMLKIGKNRSGPKPQPLDAVFERANGQVFREMNTCRAHHAHEPRDSEDVYKQMAAEQAAEGGEG